MCRITALMKRPKISFQLPMAVGNLIDINGENSSKKSPTQPLLQKQPSNKILFTVFSWSDSKIQYELTWLLNMKFHLPVKLTIIVYHKNIKVFTHILIGCGCLKEAGVYLGFFRKLRNIYIFLCMQIYGANKFILS